MAVAGPIEKNRVTMTNRDFVIDGCALLQLAVRQKTTSPVFEIFSKALINRLSRISHLFRHPRTFVRLKFAKKEFSVSQELV